MRRILFQSAFVVFAAIAATDGMAETGFTADGAGLHLTMPVMPERPKACEGEKCAAVAARSQDVLLDQHGACRFIDTPGASNKAFVPAKTAEEFSAFIGADVPGMTKSTCCRPTTVTLHSKVSSKSMDIDLPYARHGDTLRLFTDVAHPNEICSVVIETGEKTCEDFSWTEQIDQEYSCVGQTWIAGTMEHTDPPDDVRYLLLTGISRRHEMPEIREMGGLPVSPEAPNITELVFYAPQGFCTTIDHTKYYTDEEMTTLLDWGHRVYPSFEEWTNPFCKKTLAFDNTHPKINHWTVLRPEFAEKIRPSWEQHPYLPTGPRGPWDDHIAALVGIPITPGNLEHIRGVWFHHVINSFIGPYLTAHKDEKLINIDICDGRYFVRQNHPVYGPYEPGEPMEIQRQRISVYSNCKMQTN